MLVLRKSAYYKKIMNSLAVFISGLTLLAFVSMFQPMRGWLNDLLSQWYLLLFILPILILFGWPIDDMEAYRAGSELGWQRVARIVLFTGFFGFKIILSLYQRSLIIPRSGVLAIFVVYTLLAATSAFYSPEPLQSLWKAFELLVLLMFASGLYAHLISRPENNVVEVTNALLYLVFSLCLMSIVGGFLAPELAWRDFGYTGLGTRSMSGVVPMVNPNMLGQLGGIVALSGLVGLLITANVRVEKGGNWFVLIVGLLTLFLAYSRTSILSFIFFFALLFFLFKRRYFLVFVIPVFLLVWALFSNKVLEYLARGQDVEHFASMSGRIGMWEASLDAWYQSPLLGHGFFVGHKYVQISNGKFLATTDNTYVETLVNLGLTGFMLMVVFAVGVFYLAWQVLNKCRNRKQEVLYTATVLFVFVGFMIVRSITASSFQVLHYNLLFMMVAIVTLHTIKWRM